VEHFFGGVPIVEYQNNDELQGDFEKELTLINAYDLVQSNSANMFEYNDDAILMIKNMSATEGKDVENAKKSRRVMVDGDGGLEWVTKDQSDQAIENYKTRLASDIHKFSKTPDLTDEAFSGNISGIAIEFKLWGLEQNASQKERKFKKGLQRRIELITNILNVRGGNYDWRDIKITFTRNMPTNAKEIVEMVNMLRGFLSNKTLISQLPFIGDVNEELELIEQEKDEAFDLLDDVEEVGDDIEREESTRTTEDDGQAGT
jgi:SPP1 family phage portal protein